MLDATASASADFLVIFEKIRKALFSFISCWKCVGRGWAWRARSQPSLLASSWCFCVRFLFVRLRASCLGQENARVCPYHGHVGRAQPCHHGHAHACTRLAISSLAHVSDSKSEQNSSVATSFHGNTPSAPTWTENLSVEDFRLEISPATASHSFAQRSSSMCTLTRVARPVRASLAAQTAINDTRGRFAPKPSSVYPDQNALAELGRDFRDQQMEFLDELEHMHACAVDSEHVKKTALCLYRISTTLDAQKSVKIAIPPTEHATDFNAQRLESCAR